MIWIRIALKLARRGAKGRRKRKEKREGETELRTPASQLKRIIASWSLSVCSQFRRQPAVGVSPEGATDAPHHHAALQTTRSARPRHASRDWNLRLMWNSLPQSYCAVGWKWTLTTHVGLRAFTVRVGASPHSPSAGEVWREQVERRL